MMGVRLNVIVAVSSNMGIGFQGHLPWKLRTEMEYFTRMTTQTKNPRKKNVVIMGKNTWCSIPTKFRPLPNRMNIVLTTNEYFNINHQDVLVRHSLDAAIETLTLPEIQDIIEKVWVIGGNQVYKATMESKFFYRLYLTEIKAHFECDTFMPPLPAHLQEVNDPDVPTGVNEENGIKFVYKVFENPSIDNK